MPVASSLLLGYERRQLADSCLRARQVSAVRDSAEVGIGWIRPRPMVSMHVNAAIIGGWNCVHSRLTPLVAAGGSREQLGHVAVGRPRAVPADERRPEQGLEISRSTAAPGHRTPRCCLGSRPVRAYICAY